MLTHRIYLALAIPLIFSTVTTPLLGAVDTAVVGWLPDPAYIGGVAIASMIFNTMYWLFGFLRVSTSGFTAQADGARDSQAMKLALMRPFLVALLIGCLFILLQWPIKTIFFSIMNPDQAVLAAASDYFMVRIWGAPFVLMNYVILGWMMGRSLIKASFWLQVWMNVSNIILDIVFVKGFSFGIAGVAAATLISEISAFLIGLFIIRKSAGIRLRDIKEPRLFEAAPFLKMMAVNRDLMIRTVCLLAVFNAFTARGASFGTDVLAANAILIQVHYIMAYFFDGFANASSILTGRAVGADDKDMYKKTVSLSIQWSAAAAVLLTAAYFFLREPVIGLFTNLPQVLELADSYSAWLLLFPASGALGLVLYGVFTGASQAAPVRNSIAAALGIYLLIQWAGVPAFENHGLWLAFISFTLARSVFLVFYMPALGRRLFPLERDRDMDKKAFADQT